MIFAHSFIGLFVAKRFDKNYHKTDKMLIWIAAILGSIFPDVDIPYIVFVNPLAKHREIITHSIFLHLLILSIGLFILNLKNFKKLYKQIVLAFFAGSFFHLLADLLVDKVYLFRPISRTPVMFRLFPLNKSDGFLGYMRSPFILLELTLILGGLALLIKDFRKFNKEFKIILGILAIILLVAFISLIPFLREFN